MGQACQHRTRIASLILALRLVCITSAADWKSGTDFESEDIKYLTSNPSDIADKESCQDSCIFPACCAFKYVDGKCTLIAAPVASFKPRDRASSSNDDQNVAKINADCQGTDYKQNKAFSLKAVYGDGITVADSNETHKEYIVEKNYTMKVDKADNGDHIYFMLIKKNDTSCPSVLPADATLKIGEDLSVAHKFSAPGSYLVCYRHVGEAGQVNTEKVVYSVQQLDVQPQIFVKPTSGYIVVKLVPPSFSADFEYPVGVLGDVQASSKIRFVPKGGECNSDQGNTFDVADNMVYVKLVKSDTYEVCLQSDKPPGFEKQKDAMDNNLIVHVTGTKSDAVTKIEPNETEAGDVNITFPGAGVGAEAFFVEDTSGCSRVRSDFFRAIGSSNKATFHDIPAGDYKLCFKSNNEQNFEEQTKIRLKVTAKKEPIPNVTDDAATDDTATADNESDTETPVPNGTENKDTSGNKEKPVTDDNAGKTENKENETIFPWEDFFLGLAFGCSIGLSFGVYIVWTTRVHDEEARSEAAEEPVLQSDENTEGAEQPEV